MKISKEKLIEDFRDTESNDFEGVISNLFEKYSVQEYIKGYEGGDGEPSMTFTEIKDHPDYLFFNNDVEIKGE